MSFPAVPDVVSNSIGVPGILDRVVSLGAARAPVQTFERSIESDFTGRRAQTANRDVSLRNDRYAKLYLEIHGRMPRCARGDDVVPRAAHRQPLNLDDGAAEYQYDVTRGALRDAAPNGLERIRSKKAERGPSGGADNSGPTVDTNQSEREAPFRALFESNPVAMWVLDRESLRFTAVNAAAMKQLGYTLERFLQMTLRDICPPGEEDWACSKVTLFESEQQSVEPRRYVKADGCLADVVVHWQTLTYRERRAVLASVVDATDGKRAQGDGFRDWELLDSIVENIPSALFVKEPREHRYVFVNRRCEQLLGIPREELIGKTDQELFAMNEGGRVLARERDALHGGSRGRCKETIWTRSNGTRDIAIQRTTIGSGHGESKYLLGVADDVTLPRPQTKGALPPATRAKLRDVLTDLPNRAAFARMAAITLNWARAREGGFATVRLDLERSRELEESLGRCAGDALLREVAKRLKSSRERAFLARIGGDSFALLCADGPQPQGAITLVGDLLAAMEDEFEVEGQRIQLNLSVGISRYPTDGDDASVLLEKAGVALRRAKAYGGGARIFDIRADGQV
jgi:diguanylate cyclase (GGDEF)-like protein/PAS domain S-box-containing protein